MSEKISRRKFLGSAAAAATFTILPSGVLGGAGVTSANEKLNIAAVGIGGMGKRNLKACENENIVALCDVDDEFAGPIFDLYPKAKRYRDFRKMLEKQKDIDAVIVATPDHTHAVIAMMAMQMGKHVYVQKPLTHDVYEARMLTEAARKYKVVTQMGNQGHSGEGIRLICEWIWDGAIGDVREVHTWTDRPMWPQGVGRPVGQSPVPKTLDWDLWLGPAPFRPYVGDRAYHPFNWRGRWDFGTGVQGDMGCHVIDPAFWALKLGYPDTVEASYDAPSAKFISESAPLASIIHYRFPARGEMPPVELTWYDGGLMPPRPAELEPGRRMGNNWGGVLFIGDNGTLMCGGGGENPRLIPETKMKEYNRPSKSLPRVGGTDNHEKDWIQACKDGGTASCNFDYAGLLTEMVLLGNVALRSGEKIYWDGANMKATNLPKADVYVRNPYRQGWSL